MHRGCGFIHIARVQGEAARKKLGDTAILGKGAQSKMLGVGGLCPGHWSQETDIIMEGMVKQPKAAGSHTLLCFRITWGAWKNPYTQCLPRALNPNLWGWD